MKNAPCIDSVRETLSLQSGTFWSALARPRFESGVKSPRSKSFYLLDQQLKALVDFPNNNSHRPPISLTALSFYEIYDNNVSLMSFRCSLSVISIFSEVNFITPFNTYCAVLVMNRACSGDNA